MQLPRALRQFQEQQTHGSDHVGLGPRPGRICARRSSTLPGFLSLLAIALEQVSLDRDWRLAYHLTLLEEPPGIMFHSRQQAISPVAKPFANLVPPSLAATTLAFIREVDVLATKGEFKPKAKGSQGSEDRQDEEGGASPKRKPRFPKKPKKEEA